LTQGETTSPPLLDCCAVNPVRAACAIAYAAWKDANRTTVGEVEEAFAKVCYLAAQMLDEPAAVRWFVNRFDDTPRKTKGISQDYLAREVKSTLGLLRQA
jgi:hypothetical protein